MLSLLRVRREETVMGKFPPYAVLKSLSARLSGKEEEARR